MGSATSSSFANYASGSYANASAPEAEASQSASSSLSSPASSFSSSSSSSASAPVVPAAALPKAGQVDSEESVLGQSIAKICAVFVSKFAMLANIVTHVISSPAADAVSASQLTEVVTNSARNVGRLQVQVENTGEQCENIVRGFKKVSGCFWSCFSEPIKLVQSTCSWLYRMISRR